MTSVSLPNSPKASTTALQSVLATAIVSSFLVSSFSSFSDFLDGPGPAVVVVVELVDKNPLRAPKSPFLGFSFSFCGFDTGRPETTICFLYESSIVGSNL